MHALTVEVTGAHAAWLHGHVPALEARCRALGAYALHRFPQPGRTTVIVLFGDPGRLAAFDADLQRDLGERGAPFRRQPWFVRAGDHPLLRDPIVILAAPRSGSTLLFETLGAAPGIRRLPGESHRVMGPLLDGFDEVDDTTTAATCSPGVAHVLGAGFLTGIVDRDGTPQGTWDLPPSGGRLVEKTPRNVFRIPFLRALFRDPHFVFLYREPVGNVSSLVEFWRTFPGRRFPGWRGAAEMPDGAWRALRPPGWRQYDGRPLIEIAAFQWREANRAVADALDGLPPDRVTAVRYEDLVRRPGAVIDRIAARAGIEVDDRLRARWEGGLPLSRSTVSAPDPEKAKRRGLDAAALPPETLAVARAIEERWFADEPVSERAG